MQTAYCFVSFLLALITFLPLIDHSHWTIRILDFGKIQLLSIQLIIVCLGILFLDFTYYSLSSTVLLVLSLGFNFFVLFRYSRLVRKRNKDKSSKSSQSVSLLSVNVYQFNKSYHRFIDLVEEESPDFFLTIESNQDWENAMSGLELQYPYVHKVAKENTYGMHFYSKLKILAVNEHYFVANDIPSLEVDLQTNDGHLFSVFCVHPPPPSPTEEPTSKERDGELMSVAKRMTHLAQPCLVIGDFNDVSWSKSSLLFKKISRLVDARIGRGVLSTFHARFWLLRFPLDLIYHSSDIYIQEISVLRDIGSDHLPLKCVFYLEDSTRKSKGVKQELKKESEEKIQEAKAVESDR